MVSDVDALVAEVAAFVSLVAAFVAEVAAFVSLVAALVADVAAAVAEPKIPSTYVLVVRSAAFVGVYVVVILLAPISRVPVIVPPASGTIVST